MMLVLKPKSNIPRSEISGSPANYWTWDTNKTGRVLMAPESWGISSSSSFDFARVFASKPSQDSNPLNPSLPFWIPKISYERAACNNSYNTSTTRTTTFSLYLSLRTNLPFLPFWGFSVSSHVAFLDFFFMPSVERTIRKDKIESSHIYCINTTLISLPLLSVF